MICPGQRGKRAGQNLRRGSAVRPVGPFFGVVRDAVPRGSEQEAGVGARQDGPAAALLGLVGAKLATLAVDVGARLRLPQHRLVIPLGLATPGAVAVAINTILLLGV